MIPGNDFYFHSTAGRNGKNIQNNVDIYDYVDILLPDKPADFRQQLQISGTGTDPFFPQSISGNRRIQRKKSVLVFLDKT